ncbi:MAG: enoyl-CoA hydratase/isomerase family protein [Bacteroidales bacterium]|nr:enoyl-CoA hydratase/isomerase family protein [Bacteroidales bacterium]MBK7172136.1 enoyl-CoA hydratase/isomerase family protein [Bacteroidales bacterium]
MEYKILQPRLEGSVLLVTISRPESLNALNTAFFNELDHLLAAEASDPDVRAVILTGAGKAFVAGADIAEMVNKSPDEASDFSRRGQKTFMSIVNHPVPIIAAINGFALGGGLELAMSCDFRISVNNAKFGQPEVSLGLIPGYAATQRLSRLVGMGTALYMLTTGEMVTAEEALRMGLVQKLTEPDQLLTEALRLANQIALKGPKAVKTVKSVTRNGYHMPFPLACELEAQTFGTLFVDEGIEGMKAFLEKRKPVW